ncbi:MAG: hypothetical protein M1827_001572 [Pycnora praestabilis]|nr:MAG: hypothetical protein M1827_001572 [Pycnora praestabilis]
MTIKLKICTMIFETVPGNGAGISQWPRLTLRIAAANVLTLTEPFEITYFLLYENDIKNSICLTFKWGLFEIAGHKLALFHHGQEGIQMIEIGDSPPDIPDQNLLITAQDFTGLMPGEHNARTADLPIIFHRHLRVGERYSLQWLGDEIRWWLWSTAHHQGKTLSHVETSHALLPNIKVPSSNTIEFTVVERPVPSLQRAQWAIINPALGILYERHWRWKQGHQARMTCLPLITNIHVNLYAPYFCLTLNSGPTLSLNGEYSINITIHHRVNPVGNPENRSVTFRKSCLLDLFRSGCYALLQEVNHSVEQIPEVGIRQPLIEYVPLVIGDARASFMALAPGESHTTTINLYPEHQFGENFQVGQIYFYQFLGEVIPWWDWGTIEDHRGTEVGATEVSHGKRAFIFVPASDLIGFQVVN